MKNQQRFLSPMKKKSYLERRRELYALNHAMKRFECPGCFMAFSTEELYKEHYKERHAQKRSKPNDSAGANFISTA